jgi:hypothetical protein
MRITTRLTYVLPFLVLLAATTWLTIYYGIIFFHFYNEPFVPQIILAVVFTAGIYATAKKLAPKYDQKQLRIAFLLFPLIVYSLLSLIFRHRLYFDVLSVIFGGLYYLSFILFSRRYTAILTESSIEYTTLLGLTGEIALTTIVKLEEKRNILPYLIRHLKFMHLAKKISITFCDENLDEYEIDIFTNSLQSRKVFNTIVDHANKCGNLKIRQYAF